MTKTYKYRIILRLTVIALAGWLAFPTMGAMAQSTTDNQSRDGYGADEWKSVAVFSMISTDDGAPLIKQAMAAMNHPDLLDEFEQAQREAFATLDFSKPKGIVCQTNGLSFRFLAFAAMKDVTKLPYGIGFMFAGVNPNSDGWYKLPLPDAQQMPIMFQNVFVKQQGDWAYVCYGVISPPKELPSDPTVLLEDLPQEYPVALRLNFAALPKSLVTGYAALGKMSLSMLKTFLPMFQDNDEPETFVALAGFDFVTVFARETIDQLVKFINETETLTIGLNGNVDNDLTITCQLIAKPGTDTAKAVESIGACTTDLAGFYRPDKAIYTEIYACPIQEYELPFYKNIVTAADKLLDVVIDYMRVTAARDIPSEGIDEFNAFLGNGMAIPKKLLGVLQQTIDTGKIDCADFVTTDMTYYGAMKIGGGNALIESINGLYDLVMIKIAELNVDFGFEFDDAIALERETYRGFHFWKLTGLTPVFIYGDEDEYGGDIREAISHAEPHRLPGHLTYIIGVSDDMFVFAYGMSPTIEATLKNAIDESGKPVSMPREIAVFSADRIGQTIKTFGIDLMVSEMQEAEAVMDVIDSIPENAKIVVTQDVEANVLTWTWVFDGKLWPTVGKIFDIWATESRAVF